MMFFPWIYRPIIHRTDLFIVNGSDLEYNKNIYSFMVNDAMFEYLHKKYPEIKVKITINHGTKKVS